MTPLTISHSPVSWFLSEDPNALSRHENSQHVSPILNDLQLLGGVQSTGLQFFAYPFSHTQILQGSGPGMNICASSNILPVLSRQVSTPAVFMTVV